MKTLLIVLLLSVSAFAQDINAPSIDPDLLASWQRRIALADQVVLARQDALRKVPEFSAFEQAMKQRDAERADIASKVTAKAPGYLFDFATGKLTKAPEQTAKK